MFRRIMELFGIVGMRHFWGDYFDSRFYIAEMVRRRRTRYTLDLGCGAGVMLFLADSAERIGIEMELGPLIDAKKLDPRIEFIQADARNLPLRNGFCDRTLTMHLFPVMQNLNADWRQAVAEIQRISSGNSEILITGANRMSRHFQKTHDIDHRRAYLRHDEICDELGKHFSLRVMGYGPYSRAFMYPWKKILFKIPDKILEGLGVERFVFGCLGSGRFLRDGRSYVITGKRQDAL